MAKKLKGPECCACLYLPRDSGTFILLATNRFAPGYYITKYIEKTISESEMNLYDEEDRRGSWI